MANMGYYKGEDHQGNTMYARQRGPADKDIVGKMFGMKNVAEITQKEYEAGIAPVTPKKESKTDGTKAKAKTTNMTKPLSKMNAKELRAYADKELGLTFPTIGMKKADMLHEIKAAQEGMASSDDAAAGGEATGGNERARRRGYRFAGGGIRR